MKQRLPQLWDQPPAPPPKPPRRRPMAETSLAAKDALTPGRGTKTARILAAIRAAGVRAITRQELSTQCGIAINAVCGIVDELRTADLIFEPLRGAVGPAECDRHQRPKKGLYLLREGRKLLVAIEYLDHYPRPKRSAPRDVPCRRA